MTEGRTRAHVRAKRLETRSSASKTTCHFLLSTFFALTKTKLVGRAVRASAKVRTRAVTGLSKPVGPARSALPECALVRACVRACLRNRPPARRAPPIESAVSQIRARVTDRYRGQESLARAHRDARRVQGPRRSFPRSPRSLTINRQ